MSSGSLSDFIKYQQLEDESWVGYRKDGIPRAIPAPNIDSNNGREEQSKLCPEQTHLTDAGNAEQLKSFFKDELRFNWDTGYWLVWNGKVWKQDTGEELMLRAKDTVRRMYSEAASLIDTQARKDLANHASKSEAENRLQSMITLAKDILPIHQKELDRDKMLFNCCNGTIDLRTGRMRPHKKEDFITQLSPVTYEEEFSCPLWEKHLARVTGNNPDLISYLQRVFGYCLTGHTKEQALFFIHGQSKAGKSQTLKVVSWILGDYAKSTPSETLLVKRSNHSDIARLAGSRLVVAIEAERGEKLASALIKNMTGGDRMAARYLYKQNFEFEPTFKIFLVANDKPSIRGEDSAMWERIRLIPFRQYIPAEERDKDIAEKLEAEGPGILCWMVRGCLDWQSKGDLVEPVIVREETKMYRSEMDIIGDFLDERCIIEKRAREDYAELYQEYSDWCATNDEDALPKQTLTKELQSRNFVIKRSTGGKKLWYGLILRSKSDGSDDIDPLSHKPL